MSLDRREVLRLGAAALVLGPARAAAAEPTLLRLAERPPNYEGVRATFQTRLTPVERFYVRSHYDTPTVDPRTYGLEVGGLVERPLRLSLADLEAMPSVKVEAVLQCSGNGRALFRPRMPGVQWQRGAMGSAEWAGPRLADVLGRAGLGPGAEYVHLHGADRPVMDSAPKFLRALPVKKALHPDTIVALTMNGRPLPPLHGFPARLVVPGWVGDDWMKWLARVEVSAAEPVGFFYDTAYRFPVRPGEPGASVAAADMGVMTEHAVKSLIGSHRSGERVRAGRLAVVGVAFAGEAGIDRVEVSSDGGRTFAAAELEGGSTYGFRVFRRELTVSPGLVRIGARATDRRGQAQPERPVWNPSGYLYNAIDWVDLEVTA